MASSNGHHGYDEVLLASAPAPTKGMVQSGYATDLLVDKPKPSRRTDLEANRHKSLSSRHGSVPNTGKSTAEYQPVATRFTPTKRTPFYRTRRGIIILVIIAIVLLAAIIGGAVGGSLANKKDSKTLKITPLPSSTTTGDATGDIGSPQGSITDVSGTQPKRTTTTIFVSPSSSSTAPPAPPASESVLPVSFSLGIRP